MHDQCVIAEYESVPPARTALEVLAKAGYGPEQVSFIARGDDPALRDIAALESDGAEDEGAEDEGAAGGAGIGALLGGALSAPVAASTLVGPFMLVGPLVGVGLGAALGSLLGGAQSWGVDPQAGESYEQRVQDGAVLIIVSGTQVELREAEASLKTTGPCTLKRFAHPESAA
ncbi:MAG: DUF1269 domain-containing protein [Planctomycetales bacterium]|nr:DUF1269 domain-containing protein [Planctomycetales bacterium]